MFFVSSLSLAELQVNKDHHIQNDEKGRCAWCSIETLGLSHGYKSLSGLTKKNEVPGTVRKMAETFIDYGIPFELTFEKNDTPYYYLKEEIDDNVLLRHVYTNKKQADEFLLKNHKNGNFHYITTQGPSINNIKKACENDLGAIVIIKYNKENHAIVLIGIDENKIRFIDSNAIPGTISERSFTWFIQRWHGISFIIRK